jgi:hypothetical protein
MAEHVGMVLDRVMAGLPLFEGRPVAVPPVERYPESPGWKEWGTSREAAPRAEDAARLRERVLEVLWKEGGMTADQVAERLRLDALSVRPRVSELLRLGRVRRSGERRRTRLGKSAAVVEAVPG